MDQLTALIVDESNWLTFSMGVGLVAVAILFHRRPEGLPSRFGISAAMNLFFGVTIATMSSGHLLAVSMKLAAGTLKGSLPLLYAIGAALALPAWWLIHHAVRMLTPRDEQGRRTVALNAWLATTLLVLGLHNLPLALPAFFNIGYHLHSRRLIGWAIVGVAVVFHVGLFIGSLMFLASGQTFEQFTGIG